MLVFSYKKDYTNSCRGCTMESYGSEFKIHHFVTENEAIEHCAKLNAETQFEQVQGAYAWDHYFVLDGFEKQIQEQQWYNPELPGEWKSQGEAGCFIIPSLEQMQKINDLTTEIYNRLESEKKAADALQKEKDQKEQLTYSAS